MRRGRVAIAAALVVVLCVVVAVVLLARQPSSAKAISPEQAGASAREACAAAEQLEQLVARNASLDDVRSALRRAEGAAELAARGDASWQALDGGVKSLRIGIDADDARVTRTGIDVVRAECRRVDGAR